MHTRKELGFCFFISHQVEGYKYVLKTYLTGIKDSLCVGSDVGIFDVDACLTGLGGYVIETFSPGTNSDTGYCCPQFDISMLVEDECTLVIGSTFCDSTELGGGLRVITLDEGTLGTKSDTGYCCPQFDILMLVEDECTLVIGNGAWRWTARYNA